MEAVEVVNLLTGIAPADVITFRLGVKAASLIAVVQRRGLLLRALVANYLVVPLVVLGLLILFHASSMATASFWLTQCVRARDASPFTAMAKSNGEVSRSRVLDSAHFRASQADLWQ